MGSDHTHRALPAGVTRNRFCDLRVALHNWNALRFEVEFDEGRKSNLIVWQESEGEIHPLDPLKRRRDLRPGDRVVISEENATIISVEVYR